MVIWAVIRAAATTVSKSGILNPQFLNGHCTVQQASLDHVVMVHNWIDFSSFPLDTSPYNGHRPNLKVSRACHRE